MAKTSGEQPSAYYAAELASRNPKWHFLRVVRTLLGYPYARPESFEVDDLREANPTPRFTLLIKKSADGRVLFRQKLDGTNVANEAMRVAESDLEALSVAEFREKYAIPSN